MSGDTPIRITKQVTLHDDCSGSWQFVVEDNASVPSYYCQKHSIGLPIQGPCPKSSLPTEVGSTIVAPSRLARQLVDAGYAEYPTHAPRTEESVESTIKQVNDLLDREGLPQIDAESMGVLKIQGRRNHYQRGSTNLAGDLGMSPDDIAQMRKLAGG